MFRWLFLLALAPSLASAEIYKCDVGGQAVFSDSPCGESSERVEVDPVTVGGRLDTGTDVETYQPPKRQVSNDRDECPYVDSTRLRRLIIQDKVVSGMKPGDVRRSWGAPSGVRTSGGLTQWAFHWPNGNHQYVYFRGGCVTDTSTYKRF